MDPTEPPAEGSLATRCRSLLQGLGCASNTAFSSSSPITIPRIVFEHAFSTAGPQSIGGLLDALSFLLAFDGLSEHVLARFRPVAVDLLARWLEHTGHWTPEEWESRLAVVAAIAGLAPELWSFATTFIDESPFRSSPLAQIPHESLLSCSPKQLHRLLLAYWRLLISDPLMAERNSWPSRPLHELRRRHPDPGVRLLAINLLSKQAGWSEIKRMEMEKHWIGDVDKKQTLISYGLKVVAVPGGGFELEERHADGWVLPLIEARRLRDFLDQAALHPGHLNANPLPPISITHLSPRTALVADRLLLRNTPLSSTHMDSDHVPTAACNAVLCTIATHFQLGLPTLLSSPPSSGKTHLFHHLSALLFPSARPTNRILTIPLADTTIDVKSLIGTYVSSLTKPGTFEWMEGALAKAVQAGRWVVFDDIDRASMEMLVTIAGLARSLKIGRPGRRAVLRISGREDIEAGTGFALFATRSVNSSAISPPTFFGSHNFSEVFLEPPTEDDVLAILSARFPALPSSVSKVLVDIWRDLRPLSKLGAQGKARNIGLRDLEKWCARVYRNLPPAASITALAQANSGIFANPVFQDEVFLEAADLFLASIGSSLTAARQRERMLEVLCEKLGIDEERATSLLDRRRPEFEGTSSRVQIGRIALEAVHSGRTRRPPHTRPFALTRPTLVLLERVAAALALGEPSLLVGETGTGKTTAVQYIADAARRPLTVLNLSTQTESSDLLGGFKPLDPSVSARDLHSRWQKLFCETFVIGKAQNAAYLETATKAFNARRWSRLSELWCSSARRAVDKLTKKDEPTANGDTSPRKRRKILHGKVAKAAILWQTLLVDVTDFDLHHVKANSKVVFAFVEGPLVRALQKGEWILLDEINLATQETLEAISTILEGAAASLVLTERGDVEPVPRHPDFRLFACMNPATDVGKKELPPNLRSRFTELYVPPPDDDREALVTIVGQYLGNAAASDKAVILDVVEMYTTLKRLSSAKHIVDGSNIAPHYSMRTLARALMFALEVMPMFGLRRALWEGCLMAFTMSLDAASARRAHGVCEHHLLSPLKNARAVLAQVPSFPLNGDVDDYVRFGSFWLRRGPLPAVEEARYVITPSVQAKLADLARVILTRRYPVLIQGPTSSGKTSAVEFLARQTGHQFVRINNHEHTDIQEYLGTYVTHPSTGQLVFQEGLLVTAVRQGHWIVLDELNLAPTDVLEALNRLLDDNRELVIPETQEVVKPHPNFILFATQNPPGLYAGRKVLSRAFRNRFLEVHFDDVPKDELETILCQRCQIAPSYAKKIVQVFEELRHRRQASRVFESRQSFATLRDLFRWAERGAVGYQQLAEDGYMLLAERARHLEDKQVICEVIQDIMKVTVDESKLYDIFDRGSTSSFQRLPFEALPPASMVWTRAMQRLFSLVASALARNEPVLLVGETGCGKTSICEVMATAFQQSLVGVNCHQNMETADLLGSQRPVRNRQERRLKVITSLSAVRPIPIDVTIEQLLSICDDMLSDPLENRQMVQGCHDELKRLSALFEWSDGPLMFAMQAGDLLLLDEVSLADDSVLERLNSVLEPGRTLVLAEKGAADIDEATVVAHPGFHVVATMNPGGDFGKKELSPALRNRFTEIWVPPVDDRGDLLQIISQGWMHEELRTCGPLILDFFEWFNKKVGDRSAFGLRDILAWVTFVGEIHEQGLLDIASSFYHGGQMVATDGLESLSQVSGLSSSSISALRTACLAELSRLASTLAGPTPPSDSRQHEMIVSPSNISIAGFAIPRGPLVAQPSLFRFEAPTTALNGMRVLRGCQLPKAILLEGSPGVGKTSLVSALAALAGRRLQRINLSDQTDLIDLFGSDLPVEGGPPGEFQWRAAAFLDAMQKGDWVLLDEMNLASQTVLEGLNAVLDHRGAVFVPELGRSFIRHPDFRVFAAQNPLQQGGGRKGLPKSFLNRFTKVYLQEHTSADLALICHGLHRSSVDVVDKMIAFNEAIRNATMVSHTIGREGSPWEFNLRDLFRWFQLLAKPNGLELSSHPVEYVRLVYSHRFRNDSDRQAVTQSFMDVFQVEAARPRPTPYLTTTHLQIGHSLVARSASVSPIIEHSIAHEHLDIAESVLKCVEMGWLVILAGGNGHGKRSLLRTVANTAGQALGEATMHPGIDTSEILGSFEQQDAVKLLDSVHQALIRLADVLYEDQIYDRFLDDTSEAYQACRDNVDSQRLEHYINLVYHTVAAVPDAMTKHDALEALGLLRKAGPHAGGFAWVDGDLLTAIRNGEWFLISDANLCSPSVLDRLNSLCETNGVLVLSEKGSSTGSPEIVRPHPEFRLFMTYDPKHGELSRAMRNRGVELFLPVPSSNVTKAFVSPPLADHAMFRHHAMMTSSCSEMNLASTPVMLANALASQSIAVQPFLGRLRELAPEGQQDLFSVAAATLSRLLEGDRLFCLVGEAEMTNPTDSQFMRTLPFDPSLNPNVKVESAVYIYRVLLLLLRTEQRTRDLQSWLSRSENGKTILAISARAVGKPTSRKQTVSYDIYPLVSALRSLLANEALFTSSARNVGKAEDISVFLQLLEDHSKSEVFDYSAIQLLAEWLDQESQDVELFVPVLKQLRTLMHSVQLTSGLGQAEIWETFRHDVTGVGTVQLELELPDLDRVADSELRFSLLQGLMVAASDDQPNSAVERLKDVLSSLPRTAFSDVRDIGDGSYGKWNDWGVMGKLELSSLVVPDNKASLLLLVSNTRMPIISLLPAADIRRDKRPSIFFAAVNTWLDRLWRHPGIAGSGMDGPAMLFKPEQLIAVLRFADNATISMAELPSTDEALRFTTNTVLFSARHRFDARRQSGHLLFACVSTLVSAFGVNVPGYRDARAIDEALVRLESVSPGHFLFKVYERHLRKPLNDLSLSDQDLGIIGTAWQSFSRALLELYVTNIPIDPAVRRLLLGEVVSAKLALLNDELVVIERDEIATKGISDSARVRKLQHRKAMIQEESDTLGPEIARSAVVSRLALLFNEVHSFLGDQLNKDSMTSLVNDLRMGHAQAMERENSFQLASSAFIHRLSANFTDLVDLTTPIISALLFARFGLRIQARDFEQSHQPTQSVLSALMTFPKVSGYHQLREQAFALSRRSSDSVAEQLVLSYAWAADTIDPQCRSISMPGFISQLDGLYQTWSAIRLREQQESQAAESLYRVKKTDIEVLSDRERDEKEFAELFPQYDDVEELRQPSSPARPDTGSHIGTQRFLPSHIASFHNLIASIFASEPTFPAISFDCLVEDLLHTNHNLATQSEYLDGQSLAFQIQQLYRKSTSTSTSISEYPNFYLSPNENEIRKAHSLLVRLMARLDTIIHDWPDQMVPQHIRERCQRILSLDIKSPVAQVLADLEKLLIHTDDWEAYANSENSIKAAQTEVSSLIIGWRRLELASWTRLLDDQARQYLESDAEWTLRLYGSLVHGAASAEDLDKHLEQLLPMLSTYLQTSTFGLFGGRISLLAHFERMTRELSQSSKDQLRSSKVSTVLHNILENVRLFEPKVRQSLQSQREVIDKAIKDFIKLASWKDINVFALKASAQKSHRQLHRSIRKFRELLQQPVSPILSDLNTMFPQDPVQLSTSLTSRLFTESFLCPAVMTARAKEPMEASRHLQQLPETLTRYRTLTSLGGVADVSIGSFLDTKAVDVIETAEALQKATPAALTKTNAKVVKNIASRKRKAYSDLLKTLRSLGFSQNVRADAMQRQNNSNWLMRRIPLDCEGLPAAFDLTAVRKIEHYHYRQCVLMDTLRTAFNGHNPDIASQDLQRGIGYVESLFATSLSERDDLALRMRSLTRITSVLLRLQHLATADTLYGGNGFARLLAGAEVTVSRLHDAICEVDEGVKQFRALEESRIRPDDLQRIQGVKQGLAICLAHLSEVNIAARQSGIPLFTDVEIGYLRDTQGLVSQVQDDFSAQIKGSPELSHLLRPVGLLAGDSRTEIARTSARSLSAASWGRSDDLIQSLLVVAQQLVMAVNITDDDDTPNIPKAFSAEHLHTASLHIEQVLTKVESFAGELVLALANSSATDATLCIQRILPFLETLSERYGQAILAQVFGVKSMYKLSYVIGRIMLDLAQKGFCKPSGLDETAGEGAEGDTVEGTGMGSGSGEKNVSSEIKEESQVEGLQGEEEEEQDENREEKGQDEDDDDDAVTMEEDFDGQLENGKEKDGEGSDGEQDEDHDEHAGDVDPLDPGAVDEKFWGEDVQKDGQGQQDEEVAQGQAESQPGDVEMSAKEDQSEAIKQKKKDEGKDQVEAETQHEDTQVDDITSDDTNMTNEEQEDLDDERNENDPVGEEQRPSVNLPEGDRLDLPEDLQLPSEDGDQEGDDLDDGMSLPEEEGEGEGDERVSDIDMTATDDGQIEEDAPPPTAATEDENIEPDSTIAPDVDLSASNDAQAQDSAEFGKGLNGTSERPDKVEQENVGEESAEHDEAGIEAETQGVSAHPQQGPSTDPAQSDGPADASGAPIPATQQQPQSTRSLGDIVKDIQRRRDEIAAQQGQEQSAAIRDKASEGMPRQVEYVQDDQEAEEMQALGPAGEEERQKLADLKILDEEADEGETEPAMDRSEEGQTPRPPASGPDRHLETQKTQFDHMSEVTEKAVLPADIKGHAPTPGANLEDEVMEMDDDEAVKLDHLYDDEDDPADIQLQEVDSDLGTVPIGEETWRHYASLTSDLSYALCEQLRLVLEPTLATRLQGDFRTGKRLNMRKIIPYIASDYTKDKIWLRRTKPSRREYQVLLSLDDSRSMAESQSVHLAYQTLALVCQALNKLEVGQVSIARFGEGVDVLHPFGDAGFTNSDGAKIMGSFRFDQHRTDVAALVDRTLSYLAEARQKQSSNSTAPDLWQLQIIISDGVCQDHDRLRTLLRRALEERVMIVFIVVDSMHQSSTADQSIATGPQARPSILSMQTVEYKSVNGEMQLEMQRYLDTFPFEYYVVLRDVEALPGVLADTLRQWMVRVSQSQE